MSTSLESEPAVADAGAVTVEGFAIMVEIMVGIPVIMAMCTQRYQKGPRLNISNDMRRLSTSQMTETDFISKLIRYARYTLSFQWFSYFICHILILSHEFSTEPVIIDHIIYILFIINLIFLFLTFRNIGIYYFFSFTDNKNFCSPLIKKEREEQKADELDTLDPVIEDIDDEKEEKYQDIQLNDDDTADRKFSHHHWNDPDFMPDPAKNIKKSGNVEWDNYNMQRLQLRIFSVHIFRCIAYISIIYVVGYIIAVIYGHNNVVLATLALADIFIAILVGAHMYFVRQLIRLLNKYQSVFSKYSYDDAIERQREERLFELNRWWMADIGVMAVLIVKCIVLLIQISETESEFSWPASHPVFLATTFVMICTCQMTCCRYIWITRTK